MEWGKLFANLVDDPRVQAVQADGDAGWLLVESFCYCTRAESGGFIPRTQVERFGGGERLAVRVAALVREGLWIPVDNGYLLDPEIWTEERNLSDSAEKKKKADRERIARKRAEERARKNGEVSRDMSRDDRATGSATGDATGRGHGRAAPAGMVAGTDGTSGYPQGDAAEPPPAIPTQTGTEADSTEPVGETVARHVARQSPRLSRPREEKRRSNPPLPPSQRGLWPAPLPGAGGGGGEQTGPENPVGTERETLAAEITGTRPEWSRSSVLRALTAPSVTERPWPVVAAAMRLVAADPETSQPGRLAKDGPWWAEAARRTRPRRASLTQPPEGTHAYADSPTVPGRCLHCQTPQGNYRHLQEQPA